jgi:hypothetical protein
MKNLLQLLLSIPSNFLNGYQINMPGEIFIVRRIVPNGQLEGQSDSDDEILYLEPEDIEDTEVEKLINYIHANFKPVGIEISKKDADFIITALNQMWNKANDLLQAKSGLGDMERENLEYERKKSKELMKQLGADV